MDAPLVHAQILVVPLSSLKGTTIVENKEAATRSRLPLIYPKAKEKEYDFPDPDVHDISVVFDIGKSQDGEQPEFEAPTEASSMPIIQEENQAKSTVQTGTEMEIPTKEASEVEELSQGPTVDNI